METTSLSAIGIGRQTWNFVRHFLEMCVSMCMGGAILSLVVFAGIPALTGGGNLRALHPELSLFTIAVLLTLPMAAWMTFRGMAWRPTLEMSCVPIGLAVLLIGLAWTGWTPPGILQIEFGTFCGIACVGMLVVMLFRFDLYSGRTGHHMSHAPHPA
jgi:hypothetical protein